MPYMECLGIVGVPGDLQDLVRSARTPRQTHSGHKCLTTRMAGMGYPMVYMRGIIPVEYSHRIIGCFLGPCEP